MKQILPRHDGELHHETDFVGNFLSAINGGGVESRGTINLENGEVLSRHNFGGQDVFLEDDDNAVSTAAM